MARIDPATGGGEVRERIIQRRGGRLRPLADLLLHSPPVADGWNALLGAVRSETQLPAALRELVVLRIAVLNRAEYEWWAHVGEARRAGATEAHLAAVRVNASDPVFSAAERAALSLTDCMTNHVLVPDTVFDGLREHFNERQIVELTATVATYNMVSRFLVALGVSAPAHRLGDDNGRDGAT